MRLIISTEKNWIWDGAVIASKENKKGGEVGKEKEEEK